MNEEIKFSTFIDSIGEGAARSRSIISYILIATFITLLALFNSLKPNKNWLSSRLDSLHCAKIWAHFPDKSLGICKDTCNFIFIDTLKVANRFTFHHFKTQIAKNLNCAFVDSVKVFPKNVQLSFPEYCLDSSKKVLFNEIDTNELKKAIKYFSEFQDKNIVINESELNWQITNFNRAFIDNSLLINIPILGISFDVNGLAIISAVTFSILFFLLFYNLARERKNLTLVFKRAEKLEVDKVSLYQLLSMRQVLTIPGSIDEYIELKEARVIQNDEKVELNEKKFDQIKFYFLNILTFLPLLIPVLAWYLVYNYDTKSSQNIGYSINEELTKWTFNTSLQCGVVMFGLWLICVYEWFSITQIWNHQKNDIRRLLLDYTDNKNSGDSESKIENE